MKHIPKVLEKIGYKPQEVKVYLAVLSAEESTISDIAEKVSLPRTSVQIIADKLHKDGLLNFYEKRRYKYWTAENPEKILARLKENEFAIKSIIPELLSMKKPSGTKPVIKIYKGAEEMKLIHDDIINDKHNISAIISWWKWLDLLGQEYMDDFIQRRVDNFLKINLLIPESETGAVLKLKDQQELRNTRYLPNNITINTTNFIYGTKVVIISLNKEQPVGILIDDASIHDTIGSFFNYIWNQSQ